MATATPPLPWRRQFSLPTTYRLLLLKRPAMLERRLTLLQAVSVNMSLMVGIGPFITIPLLVASMHGPQSMIGWFVGAAVAVCDGMVWSELAAAFPGSGGTYHFYDVVYGNSRAGRLLKFVFVWQFMFSVPLEVTSGAIGLAKYLGYFYPGLASPAWHWRAVHPLLQGNVAWGQLAAMGVMIMVTALAYRRIAAAGRLMVVLWAGMLLTVGWVVVTALTNFDAARAFDFPKMTWGSGGFTFVALGGLSRSPCTTCSVITRFATWVMRSPIRLGRSRGRFSSR